MGLTFTVEKKSKTMGARSGRFLTSHGEVQTPIFMPVGTQAAVKSLTPQELEDLGATIILGNTYHLAIRPGTDVVRELGGMHRMYGWRRSILTDSGGFQVLSLAKLRKVSEEGVRFQNHIDGGLLNLTPEHAIEIQEAIGSDIMMCLDHLAATTAPIAEHEEAMARTTRWAKRCLDARTTDNSLFGILQGGTNFDLRTRHVEEMCQLDFDGFAIGGLSVGESIPEMYAALAHTAPQLPENKPRYLMGVGTPTDLVEGVARGVDMFDCVMPTRNARKGGLFVDGGRRKMNIRNAQFQRDDRPIDENCGCFTCRTYSRGYLRHLLKVGELLVHRLLSIHNLYVYLDLMSQMRRAIREERFEEFYNSWHGSLDHPGSI